jgi:hypothetical protein
LAASCGSPPTGPSISGITLSNVSLQSTTGNNALCCCHVIGTAENHNEVPVHLTIKFSALGAVQEDAIATVVAFVPDLEPGARRPIDAAGFIFPCQEIRSLRTEVDVSGIAFPPL